MYGLLRLLRAGVRLLILFMVIGMSTNMVDVVFSHGMKEINISIYLLFALMIALDMLLARTIRDFKQSISTKEENHS